MYLFVVALHVLLCLILMLVILLQPGKGADVGAAFGGGGSTSTIFGPRGPANLLTRATTVVAVLFMVTSITLSLYSSRSNLADVDVAGAMRELQEREKGKDETVTPEEAPAEDPLLDEAPGGE